jgi:hypothetical protein
VVLNIITMSKVRKTYQALVYLEHTLVFQINERRVEANFTGMNREHYKRFATFTTYNPDLQKCIEEHPNFNKEFKLIDTKAVGEIEEKELKEDNGNKGSKDEPLVLSEIETVDAAKTWLNKEKGIPFSQLANGSAIIKVCKEQNVSMPVIENKFKTE